MRLINADVLDFSGKKYNKSQMTAILDFLQNQPTVYNLEEIIKELEEEKDVAYADFDTYVDEFAPELDPEYDDLFHRGLERSIKKLRKELIKW